MPGTDRWKPILENPEAIESVPGALIVRIRENLDFGRLLFRFDRQICMLTFIIIIANTSQLKGFVYSNILYKHLINLYPTPCTRATSPVGVVWIG